MSSEYIVHFGGGIQRDYLLPTSYSHHGRVLLTPPATLYIYRYESDDGEGTMRVLYAMTARVDRECRRRRSRRDRALNDSSVAWMGFVADTLKPRVRRTADEGEKDGGRG